MSDFAEFKDDINRTAVSAELLGEVMMMYGEIAPEERGFEARAERVVALLTKKGHGEKRGLLAMAVMIRLWRSTRSWQTRRCRTGRCRVQSLA